MKFNDAGHFKAAKKALNPAAKKNMMPAVKLFGFTWAVPEFSIEVGHTRRELTVTLIPAIEVPDDKPVALVDRICEYLDTLGVVPFVSPTVVDFDTAPNDWESDKLAAEGFPKINRKKSWNGEGLPPVGTVCEFVRLDDCQKETLQSGARVTVIAHYESTAGLQVAVFTYDHRLGRDVESAVADCFRPIRTAEQLAAEEREKAIDRMCKVVMAHPRYAEFNRNADCSAAMRLAIEALYDDKAFAADA